MSNSKKIERNATSGRLTTGYSVKKDVASNGRKFTVSATDGPHKGQTVRMVGISARHAYYNSLKKEPA